MERILQRYETRFSHIVGFRPTGWSFAKGMEKTRCERRSSIENRTIIQVRHEEAFCLSPL